MPKEHSGLRRQAIQIAAQLPDNTTDALAVLDYARALVVGFLDDPEEEPASDNVTVFPTSASSR